MRAKSQLFFFVAVCPWASYLTSLGLALLICKEVWPQPLPPQAAVKTSALADVLTQCRPLRAFQQSWLLYLELGEGRGLAPSQTAGCQRAGEFSQAAPCWRAHRGGSGLRGAPRWLGYRGSAAGLSGGVAWPETGLGRASAASSGPSGSVSPSLGTSRLSVPALTAALGPPEPTTAAGVLFLRQGGDSVTLGPEQSGRKP